MSDPAPTAFWVREPGRGALGPASWGDGPVRVRALASAVSRGTESLVFRGGVPAELHALMRCPFQEGEFPGPVKYGYSLVGVVEEGPPELAGRTVFCLHPHQDRFRVPAAAALPVPDGVPVRRATLAANLETAVNLLWDALPPLGVRAAVVGGGVVGCLAAWLLARLPGAAVQLVDVNPARAAVAADLGVAFAGPDAAAGDRDLVVHASGTPEGLATALRLAGFEATVVEASWYGDRPVPAPLGGAFHPRRLRLLSSQVGSIAPALRGRRSHRERLELALALLADRRLDSLLTGDSPFADLPALMPRLAAGSGDALCHTIHYG
ncbi:zinc-dependent alcohol dehydrogenase [Azospirillum sp. ST 5-10]|uniref:zinc-dependent alcohol dehydrogenase n=1 Tax=unclassified Azospirillum TaxID=2630922 RepID=UPI003F49F4D6